MMAKVSTFRAESHLGNFWVVFGLVGGCCLGMMGREAMEMKWRMFEGGRARGPWVKEKRRSLKMASQTRKKEVNAIRLGEERVKGRMMKM